MSLLCIKPPPCGCLTPIISHILTMTYKVIICLLHLYDFTPDPIPHCSLPSRHAASYSNTLSSPDQGISLVIPFSSVPRSLIWAPYKRAPSHQIALWPPYPHIFFFLAVIITCHSIYKHTLEVCLPQQEWEQGLCFIYCILSLWRNPGTLEA